MDQVFIWNALKDLRDGHFRMPRYWGQNYGSMLEAWLAIPFDFLPYEKVLPLSAYIILIAPYLNLIISLRSKQNFGLYLFSIICFACCLPATYWMIGFMPRDMGTGIFVCSFGFLFLNNTNEKFRLFFITLFGVLGWSVNANSIILGFPIIIYTFFGSGHLSIRDKIVYIISGASASLMVHFGIQFWYQLHPYLAVQKSWGLNFGFENFEEAIHNLDNHWGYITPVLERKSWTYIGLILAAGITSYLQRKFALLLAVFVLCILLAVSLSLDKVHDGVGSVFFSYDRMFLALPIAVIFLLSQLRLNGLVLLPFPLAITAVLNQMDGLQKKVDSETLLVENTVLTMAKVDFVYEGCESINLFTQHHRPGAIFFQDLDYSWIFARACPCLGDIPPIVNPSYDRQTWNLNKYDNDTTSTIAWFKSELDIKLLKNQYDVNVDSTIVELLGTNKVYIIKGDNMNPIKVYEALGYESVSYR